MVPKIVASEELFGASCLKKRAIAGKSVEKNSFRINRATFQMNYSEPNLRLRF